MNELGDILRHHGVKGMKWGVRNDKRVRQNIGAKIDVINSKRKRTVLGTLDGLSVPAIAAAAIYAGDSIASARTKRKIAKAFNSKVRDFDKKDLRKATMIVRNFSDVTLTVEGKNIKMTSLNEDILQHHGVKGMKWGVRRDRGRLSKSGSRQNGDTLSIKDHASSVKREVSMVRKTMVNNQNKMTTKEIKKHTERLRLENDLKRLSRITSPAGTRKDRKDYVKRAKMSDAELRRKVDRLRNKELFKKQAFAANKSHVDVGKRVVAVVAPMAVGYVVARHPDLSKKIKDLNTKENRDLVLKVIKTIK